MDAFWASNILFSAASAKKRLLELCLSISLVRGRASVSEELGDKDGGSKEIRNLSLFVLFIGRSPPAAVSVGKLIGTSFISDTKLRSDWRKSKDDSDLSRRE